MEGTLRKAWLSHKATHELREAGQESGSGPAGLGGGCKQLQTGKGSTSKVKRSKSCRRASAGFRQMDEVGRFRARARAPPAAPARPPPPQAQPQPVAPPSLVVLALPLLVRALQGVVAQQPLDEVHVRHDHAAAAVAVEVERVERLTAGWGGWVEVCGVRCAEARQE